MICSTTRYNRQEQRLLQMLMARRPVSSDFMKLTLAFSFDLFRSHSNNFAASQTARNVMTGIKCVCVCVGGVRKINRKKKLYVSLDNSTLSSIQNQAANLVLLRCFSFHFDCRAFDL